MDETNTLRQWPTACYRVWQVEADEAGEPVASEQEIEMVLEEPLALYVNGDQAAILMRLPGMEKELAAAFVVSEGLVPRFADVLVIHHCGQGLPSPVESDAPEEAESRNRVDVMVSAKALRSEARLEVARLIRAGCGAVDIARENLPLPTLPGGPQVAPRLFLGLEREMRRHQGLHRRAGGVHAAALFNAMGELIILSEDVGRHNAMDKAIGYCLLRRIPLEDKVLLSSGRLSYEMVTKAIRTGLPLLASVSAPTALAVQFAEKYNLTVLGYVRGHRMTIYSHPERIGVGELPGT